MSTVWDIVLWSAIPIALLLPVFTFGTYQFFRYFNERGRPPELPVERAYREATARGRTVREPGRMAGRPA
jgi:hypothetical protein